MSDGRMQSQDIAKGICILIVLFVHCVTVPKGIHWFFYPVLGFAMPFFFIISGYNYHPGKRSPKDNIVKRFKQLFKPLIKYSIILLAVFGIIAFSKGESVETIVKSFFVSVVPYELNLTGPVAVPSWFLWYMFFGNCVFFFIADKALENDTRCLLVVLGLILLDVGLFILVPFDSLGLLYSPMCAAMLFIGAWMGKMQLLAKENGKTVLIVTILCVLTNLIIGNLLPYVPKFAGGKCSFAWEIPFLVICGTLFTYYLVNFSRFLEKSALLSKIFTFFGRNSMRIFLIHYSLMVFVYKIMGYEKTVGKTTEHIVPQEVLCFAIVLGFSTVVSLIISTFDKKN